MAFSSKQIPLFLILTLLSSYTQARDSQFFNKLPSTTNTNVVPYNNQPEQNQPTNVVPDNNRPEQNQPDFVPDNENGYGLYGHESGQLPPSATTLQHTESEQPARKYLPKNYNPVAYVTVPEDINDSVSLAEDKTYATNPTNYYNAEQNFYNPQQEDESTYRSYPTTAAANNYYAGESSFGSEPQAGLTDSRFSSRENYFNTGGSRFNGEPQRTRLSSPENYFNTGGSSFNGEPQRTRLSSPENYFDNSQGYQPQGMSDTRFLANGKYHYDINSEKYSSNHPYEMLKQARPTNRYFGNYGGDREVAGGVADRGNEVEFP